MPLADSSDVLKAIIDICDESFMSEIKYQHGKSPRETWLHWLKWRAIWIFGIYEFKVNCECGNKLRCTDGVKDYHYTCKCGKDYIGTKERVFT